MIANLLGILGGFILLMLGVLVGINSIHMTIGLLMMFGGIVSMLYFIPENKRDKLQDWKPHD